MPPLSWRGLSISPVAAQDDQLQTLHELQRERHQAMTASPFAKRLADKIQALPIQDATPGRYQRHMDAMGAAIDAEMAGVLASTRGRFVIEDKNAQGHRRGECISCGAVWNDNHEHHSPDCILADLTPATPKEPRT